MKMIIKTPVIFILKQIKYLFVYLVALAFFNPCYVLANEFIAQELRESTIENEVLLELESNKNFENSDLNINSSVIEDEVEDDKALDNGEIEFELFNKLDLPKQKDTTKDENLFGKILHSKITRTDVPSYLLEDDLTFEYKNGPLSKLHPWFGYRGGIQSLWRGQDYTNEYENFETQIGAYGSFKNPKYKFQVAFNPVPKHGKNYLERVFSDAFVVNTSIPNHQIIAGYSRVNLGVEGGRSAYVLPFATRSQIARNYANYRSMGLKVIGNYEYVDYNLFAGSGGRYIIHGFPGAEFNGWVNIKPFGKKAEKYGKLTIGGGFNHGHNRFDYNVGSAYISYHHKKLWTNFEAAIADGSNGSVGMSPNKSGGFAYTLGWKFNPHLQLIGRIDQFDPNRRKSNDLRREYTIGLNWFIKGQALKVVLNYVFCNNQASKDSHRIILATQILL